MPSSSSYVATRRQASDSTITDSGRGSEDTSKTSGHSSIYTRYLSQFYKTKLCKYHLDGFCNRGDNCTHAHSVEELNSQPDLAKCRMCRVFLQTGHCADSQCPYAHDLETVRSSNAFFRTKMCDFAKQGFCKLGNRCRYAHSGSEIIQDVDYSPKADDSKKPIQPGSADIGLEGKKMYAIHKRRRRGGKNITKSETTPCLELTIKNQNNGGNGHSSSIRVSYSCM
ncbi:conserved hypothetical protein [Perkinsus marinus ATCC 50983]|uniref:C3H1-type domain-containing protein n=1 Tax=Perkinsus marinus (strain ATCC 50983 / TXsc) TaxID=423536 RepID=C5KDL7_PERM5|nr:conserved hypothetical protein [Perkinsus marinus ATCC 50983]EER17320.1 conserved hypothetical protein [Perkinsus marinus ATCC 50983]|eukprot:XP_002785524.1 conserved hypothetical protein [Perkinsus marinus ATCC 50983]